MATQALSSVLSLNCLSHHRELCLGDFNSGDIIAFYSSESLFGRVIQFFTRGPSHVAIVCYRDDRLLAWHASKGESTSCALCNRDGDGVHAVEVRSLIEQAAPGTVFRLPINRPLEGRQIARLLGFLTTRDGHRYDTSRALSAGRWSRWMWPEETNWQTWFCSELVIASLVECGVLNQYSARSPAAWQPKDVVKRLVKIGMYREMECVK